MGIIDGVVGICIVWTALLS